MKEQPSTVAGIKEIARALQISIGTVDRALHSRPGVSKVTRDRVLKMAEKLNYQPNVAARALKLNHRLRVGVFLPEQIALFFDRVRDGIRAGSNAAGGMGIEIVFHSYPRFGEQELEAIETGDWPTYDGIIMAPGFPAKLGPVLRKMEASRIPVVFVVTDAARLPRLSSITSDEAVSGSIAADLWAASSFRPRR